MEAEFVNVFLEKQRDTINDLMSRIIMLEARLVIAERSATQAGEVLKKLNDAEGRVKILHEQNAAMNEVINKQKPQVEEISSLLHKIDELKSVISNRDEQLKHLQSSVNALTLEKESQRVKADRLKKKVQEIASE